MKDVALGKKVKIENSQLTIPTEIEYDKNVFEKVEVKIIKPREHNFYVNTIMDVVPISTKVIGRLGEGITHTLTGVYIVIKLVLILKGNRCMNLVHLKVFCKNS